MSQFKGKAIYQPAGKAAEYSQWACNFYVGCSNGCEYCYCKKGILAKVMGQDNPQLKKCFKDEDDAFMIFHEEMKKNSDELKNNGLFFSFTTDPMLPETIDLTMRAIYKCADWSIPVKILTKVATKTMLDKLIDESVCGIFDDTKEEMDLSKTIFRSKIAIGFTLTGHDELEPGASTNAERIEAMKKLHDAGFKTFASIEPIIDFQSSFKMIAATHGVCDLYKIGLESGKKYDKDSAILFVSNVLVRASGNNAKVYFKDSILNCWGVARESLKDYDCCVISEYNIFEK